MSYNLLLHDRPTGDEAFRQNVSPIAGLWKRSIRAVGGYFDGRFVVSDLRRSELIDAFQTWLGFRVVEKTYGMTSWEGIVTDMRLLLAGIEYRRTLDPEWWHNRVKCFYSYPDTEDTEQGALSYTTEGGEDTLTDAGQDFSEWETAAGDAAYRVRVTNADGTEAWGFLGATVSDTEIYVYQDVELATHGWLGEYDGKTPDSYAVSDVTLAGSRQETAWVSNANSEDQYGRMEHVVKLPGATPEAAEQIRDAHLDEFAWPRSRMSGSVMMGPDEERPRDRLMVECSGFWETMNWRYRSTSRIAGASDLITTLAGQTEFVSIGRVETNDMAAKVDCEPIPQRLGDLIRIVTELGDMDGNLWQCGVYADRKLIYEQAPNAVEYHLRDGRLYDKGGVLVSPSLLEPGFLLRNDNAPSGVQPPGTSSVWDAPQIAYVDEVVFEAPDRLKLRLFGEEESVITLTEQVLRGASHAETMRFAT